MKSDNPLLAKWTGPHGGVPPFATVKVEHFKPAFEGAMDEKRRELGLMTLDRADPRVDLCETRFVDVDANDAEACLCKLTRHRKTDIPEPNDGDHRRRRRQTGGKFGHGALTLKTRPERVNALVAGAAGRRRAASNLLKLPALRWRSG